MERLTKKVDGVWTVLCNYGSSPYPVVTQEIIDRLAAYEDTGFTPEEVRQMRWIPVEERLPEERGQYIVFVDVDGKVTTDFYWVCEDIKRWLSYNGGFNAFYIDPYSSKPTREPPYPRVTHWMPLPPGPSAKGEE